MRAFSKKIAAVCLLVCLFAVTAFSLFGCSQVPDDGKIKILCVLFPEYDWVKNVVGESEGLSVTLLISNGTDMHSYQPTARDITMISQCDLLVYGGGDATKWIAEALAMADNSEVKTLDISKIEGVRLHEISASSHDDHDNVSHTSHQGHNHEGHDEHLWLSLKNARVITEALSNELSSLDSENSEKYIANAESYMKKIDALDKKFSALADNTDEKNKFVLFADRFPFVYLLYDYGIGYRAPFEGCSTDANADFETVVSLIREADEHSCKYIAVTESGDISLAQTVMTSAKRNDMEIIRLHSMQSVRQREIAEGASYLSYMEDNFEVLKKILSGDK